MVFCNGKLDFPRSLLLYPGLEETFPLQSSERKNIQKGLFLLSTANLIANLLGMARSLLMVRYFGPADYAVIGICTGLPFIYQLFYIDPDSYAGFILPREAAQRHSGGPHQIATLLWDTFWIKAAFTLAVGVLMIATAGMAADFYGRPEFRFYIQMVGVWVLMSLLGGPIQGTATNAFEWHRDTFILMTLKSIGTVLILVPVILLQMDLRNFFILRTFELVPCSLFCLYLGYRHRDLLQARRWPIWRERWLSIREMLRFSFPLSLNRNVDGMYRTALFSVLTRFFSLEIVGNVTLVYNLLERCSGVSDNFLKVLSTSLTKVKTGTAIFERFKKIHVNINFVYSFFSLGVLLFAGELVRVFGGPDFTPAQPMLRDFAFAFYLMQVLSIYYALLWSTQKIYSCLWITVAKLVIVIGGSHILFGATEASVGWLAGIEWLGFLLSLLASGFLVRGTIRKTVLNREVRLEAVSLVILIVIYAAVRPIPMVLLGPLELAWGALAFKLALLVLGTAALGGGHARVANFVVIQDSLALITRTWARRKPAELQR